MSRTHLGRYGNPPARPERPTITRLTRRGVEQYREANAAGEPRARVEVERDYSAVIRRVRRRMTRDNLTGAVMAANPTIDTRKARRLVKSFNRQATRPVARNSRARRGGDR